MLLHVWRLLIVSASRLPGVLLLNKAYKSMALEGRAGMLARCAEGSHAAAVPACRLLSNNKGLNGTLPAAWAALSSLQKVFVADANLTGRCYPAPRLRVVLPFSIQGIRTGNRLDTGSICCQS